MTRIYVRGKGADLTPSGVSADNRLIRQWIAEWDGSATVSQPGQPDQTLRPEGQTLLSAFRTAWFSSRWWGLDRESRRSILRATAERWYRTHSEARTT